jgi:dihydropteroate synthase
VKNYHFVTGRLAEMPLRKVVEPLAKTVGFDYTIQVMPIDIAAMITPRWAARHIQVGPQATQVILPGYCAGDLTPLEQATTVPVIRGPKDLKQLPEHFGEPTLGDYGDYDIEILAQIRDAYRTPMDELLWKAQRLEACGAEWIVLGCDQRQTWAELGEYVGALRSQGRRVALESRNPAEIEAALAAGAEMVLSVDSSNVRQALQWGCTVVVVPDEPGSLAGLQDTVAQLHEADVPLRINPGLNPIAFGFAESLGRYLALRWQWPHAELVMSIGNVTETMAVDSAPINALLLGVCQELGIRSVLTSQENNWTRSSVQECDLARQLAHHALTHRLLPKHLEPGLSILRDPRVYERSVEEILELATGLRDRSYRIMAEAGRLHVIAANLYLDGTDPYELFEQMMERGARKIDVPYAFYLGHEMSKAVTALTIGKNYRQDDALNWGMLTVRELTRRERRANRMAKRREETDREPPAGEPCP